MNTFTRRAFPAEPGKGAAAPSIQPSNYAVTMPPRSVLPVVTQETSDQNALQYYRTINADYAIVGLVSDLGLIAQEAADRSRAEGLRAGTILLARHHPLPPQIADLLAQVNAVGIVEPWEDGKEIGPGVVGLLRDAAASPDWPRPGRVPRIYGIFRRPDCTAIQAGQLVAVVKAMHTYGPNRLLLTHDGLAKPGESARPSEGANDRVSAVTGTSAALSATRPGLNGRRAVARRNGHRPGPSAMDAA